MEQNGLLPHENGQPFAQCALTGAPAQDAPPATVTGTRQERAIAPSGPVRVLVVEDDVPLARLLCSWLSAEGFIGEAAHHAEAALAKLEATSYDLLLLDLNLPGMDGLTLLPKVHAAQPDIPVMVLTGRSRTEDTVSSLNEGAEDCLIKPFSLVELLARMRVLLRRRAAAAPEAPKATSGLLLNREEYRVERDGRRIELTPREFALLEYLMQQAPKPVSRATLMEEVWRVPFDPSTNIVDVYMKYLRDKIDSTAEQKLIRTVRGVGYALACA